MTQPWNMAKLRQRSITPTKRRVPKPIGPDVQEMSATAGYLVNGQPMSYRAYHDHRSHDHRTCVDCGYHVCSCPAYVQPHPMPLGAVTKREGYGQTAEGYDIVYSPLMRPGEAAFVKQIGKVDAEITCGLLTQKQLDVEIVCGLLTQKQLDVARAKKCPFKPKQEESDIRIADAAKRNELRVAGTKNSCDQWFGSSWARRER